MVDLKKVEKIEKRRSDLMFFAVIIIVILTIFICASLAFFDYVVGWLGFVYSSVIARVLFGLLIIGVILYLYSREKNQGEMNTKLHQELAQTVKALERKLETQTFLCAAGRALIEGQNFFDTLDSLLHKTLAFTKAEFGAVILRDDLNETGELKIYKADESPEDEKINDLGVMLARRVALKVVSNAQPLVLSGEEDAFSDLKFDGEVVFKSAMSVPFKGKEKIAGILVLWNHRSDYVFTEDDLHVLEILADEIEMAIKNVALQGFGKDQ